MISWHRDLEDAATPSEVVHLTRSYLASIPRQDLARLPEDCRPTRIDDEDDVRMWNRRLTDAYWALRSTAADVSIMQEVWGFFLRASIQLGRIEEEGTVSS